MNGKDWTRRQVLQTGALSALAASAGPLLTSVVSAEEPRVVYLAGAESHGGPQGVHVYRVQDGSWTRVQFVPMAAPSALALSRLGDRLFVARSARQRSWPLASVESFAVEQGSGGWLRAIGKGDLALGAVRPGRLAVSPDGLLLAFASEGGQVGVQTVQKDGTPGVVTAVYKDLRLAWQAPPRLHFVNAEHLVASHGPGPATLYRYSEAGLVALSREHRFTPPLDTASLPPSLPGRFDSAAFHAVATLPAA